MPDHKLMAPQVQLLPSILTADFGHLQREIEAAEAAGVDGIHLDVMDGCFVPNITFGAGVIASVRACTDLYLDVHLMVEDPLRYLADFASVGADGLTVHVEACRDPYRALDAIRNLDCKTGIALNPGTACNAVEDLLSLADVVLIMSVPPGFGGAPYIAESPAKLRRMRKMLMAQAHPIALEVDGGIGPANLRAVVEAGADMIVAGSSIYNERASVATNVDALRRVLP